MKLEKWAILINNAVFSYSAIARAQCMGLSEDTFSCQSFRNFWCSNFKCQTPEDLINPTRKNGKVSKKIFNRTILETIMAFGNLTTCLPLADR